MTLLQGGVGGGDVRGSLNLRESSTSFLMINSQKFHESMQSLKHLIFQFCLGA